MGWGSLCSKKIPPFSGNFVPAETNAKIFNKEASCSWGDCRLFCLLIFLACMLLLLWGCCCCVLLHLVVSSILHHVMSSIKTFRLNLQGDMLEVNWCSINSTTRGSEAYTEQGTKPPKWQERTSEENENTEKPGAQLYHFGYVALKSSEGNKAQCVASAMESGSISSLTAMAKLLTCPHWYTVRNLKCYGVWFPSWLGPCQEASPPPPRPKQQQAEWRNNHCKQVWKMEAGGFPGSFSSS